MFLCVIFDSVLPVSRRIFLSHYSDATNISRNVTMALHVTAVIEERTHWKLEGRLFRIDVEPPPPGQQTPLGYSK